MSLQEYFSSATTDGIHMLPDIKVAVSPPKEHLCNTAPSYSTEYYFLTHLKIFL